MAIGVYTENTQKWRLAEIDKIVDQIENEIANKINSKRLKNEHTYPNIALYTLGKTIVTMREILCLTTMGYPDGALSLARNIYEQFITIAFFEDKKDKTDFQDYIDDYFTQYQFQIYKPIKWYCEKTNKKIDNSLVQDYEKAKSEAHKKKNHGEYWWAGCSNFSELSEMVINSFEDDDKSLLYEIHLLYKRSSASLHAGFFGNSNRLGVKSDFPEIDTSATTNSLEAPLLLSVFSFAIITKIVLDIFDINCEKYNDNLSDLMLFYNRKVMEYENA